MVRVGIAFGLAVLVGAVLAAALVDSDPQPQSPAVSEALPALPPSVAEPTLELASLEPAPTAQLVPAVVVAEPVIPEPAKLVTAGHIQRGQSLHTALTRQGISARTVHDIAQAMRPVFDFRYALPGDEYTLTQLPDGRIEQFEYVTLTGDGYRVFFNGDRLTAVSHEDELVRRNERMAGIVSSSLYEAIKQLGESVQLAHDFADIFAWDIDFSREVRPGDEFRVLYERLYHREPSGSESYVRPGRILAAQYRGATGVHTAIHYSTAEGRDGYYRPDGTSVERQFLRAPLKYSRISSSYTHSRFHPILKVRRPHLGIDYAAPHGTPVWSVANGTVIFVGRSGGFGKLVKIRHTNGYISYYGHLSRYANGLTVGTRVHQKQLIGYVGSTGLATGPHVDFRIKRGGEYLNPRKLQTPPGDPIPTERMTDFHLVRDAHLSKLEPTPLVVVGEAL